MRIRVSHRTVYRYDKPLSRVIQTLRLTPRPHDGQHVVRWRIDVSEDCRLEAQDDAFGNVTHAFSADGPVSHLEVLVEGEVETQDTDGIVRGAIERFPPSLYLRETPLTVADPPIRQFARDAVAGREGEIAVLHALLGAVHEAVVFDTDPTHVTTTASEAFGLRRGVCQDLAHVFIAGARSLGIPSRYVGGYLHRSDGVVAQEAGHAWVESWVPELGWVAFDPAHSISATEAYVRVAIGLDYLGAAPVRGTRFGGIGETLEVEVQVDQAFHQVQS
ncbi:putative cysteine protease [Rhodovulum sp. PH10]|uniref:transglutaminase family protein n=1 Tax=Rhodovulum sp. PH10 TaxID=1187851 RepID=UPI00027C1E1D|nr:transglutaminase family protein [Rhodovulum sp. PH10]EJW12007.1 putative cysteine protease [Rhodovulum sp. PH10]